MLRPPVLEMLTIALVTGVAWLQWREGVFRAFLLLVNVLLAGLLAFNFWEPIAFGLGLTSPGFDRYADAVTLVVLFTAFLGGLRALTLYVAPEDPAYPPLVRRGGAVVCGLATGYLVAGLLLCVLQTLPWHERFLWYEPDAPIGLGAPDRVWLALMHRASGVTFDYPGGEPRWFDADGSFIPRYARYRRQAADAKPARNRGEFPPVLGVRPAAEPEAP